MILHLENKDVDTEKPNAAFLIYNELKDQLPEAHWSPLILTQPELQEVVTRLIQSADIQNT